MTKDEILAAAMKLPDEERTELFWALADKVGIYSFVTVSRADVRQRLEDFEHEDWKVITDEEIDRAGAGATGADFSNEYGAAVDLIEEKLEEVIAARPKGDAP